MKESIIKFNEFCNVVAGTVEAAEKKGERYVISLNVPGREKLMEITFFNEREREGSERAPIAWADRAERSKVRKGSCIAVLVLPDKNDENKASGRRLMYGGVFQARDDKEKNVIFGSVGRHAKKTSQKGNEYIWIPGVYAGTKDGKARNIDVSFFSDIENVEKELAKTSEDSHNRFLMEVSGLEVREWEHPRSMNQMQTEQSFGRDIMFIGVVPKKDGAVVSAEEA